MGNRISHGHFKWSVGFALLVVAVIAAGLWAKTPPRSAVRLKPGDRAPQFSLLDQHGKRVNLSDFKGRMLLVYFYPKANSPGCTIQAESVRDHRQELARLGVTVVGISNDRPDQQLKFDKDYHLGFPLLSDPTHATSTAWGVWGVLKYQGKQFPAIVRSSFLVGKDGRISHAWYNITPEGTVPEALKALKSRA